MKYVIGVDTGGTFTDVTVLSESGNVYTDKAPTTPRDFSLGVMNSIKEVVKGVGIPVRELLASCEMVKHGTTVGTNALITRDGAKVGLITTRGFEDTTLIMRAIGRVAGLSEMEMKHMAVARKPEPLVPRHMIKGVTERVDYTGHVLIPMKIQEAEQAIKELVEIQGVNAIAVSLLWAFRNPVHERALEELIISKYHGVHVSLAHKIAPVLREYARSNSVIINAFLDKTMHDYIGSLSSKLTENGYKKNLVIMQANGGIVSEDEMLPINTVSSGPSGGIIASKHLGDILGHPNVITTDMGGTSFDVGLIIDGKWSYFREPLMDRFHVSIPMIDIESIGAGGGTIAYIAPGQKRIMVGPKSAGSDPGPVCYGIGGENPAVTDADVILGYVDPNYFLGGRMRLDVEKSTAAMKEKVADPLGIGVVEAAAGIYDIINAKMSDLIKKKVVTTGHIPEEFVLYAFGGAGPVHAVGYAADLNIRKIYVFPTSSVFSAFGVATADVIHTQSTSKRILLPSDPKDINEQFGDIESNLMLLMSKEGFARDEVKFNRTLYMRYRRQLNEIAVEVPFKEYTAKDIEEDIVASFERKYEDMYGAGSGYTEAGIDVISFNVDAVGKTYKPALKKRDSAPKPDASAALKGHREVYFAAMKSFVRTAIYDYLRLDVGNVIQGPAIVETPTTTVVILPNATGRVDEYLNIEIEIARR